MLVVSARAVEAAHVPPDVEVVITGIGKTAAAAARRPPVGRGSVLLALIVQ